MHDATFVRHIGPDRHLDLENAVAISKADVQVAWERAYDELRVGLEALPPHGKLFIVFGLQGSGKWTWISQNASRVGGDSIFFDGPLPSRAKRARALKMAKDAGIAAVAVWLNVPLEVACARNATRRGLAVIQAEAIRHVFDQLEPPSPAEGFSEVIEVVDPGEA